jgi:protein SCO1
MTALARHMRVRVGVGAIRRIGTALALALFAASASAGLVLPGARAPAVAIEQRLGAALPLAARFVDSDGRALPLGAAFGTLPVVLVLGYYRCPNLCETVMESTLDALAQSGASRRDYRVVAVSIDPAETPADARRRRALDLAFADLAADRAAGGTRSRDALDLHALVGDGTAIADLARAVGFGFVRQDDSATGAASFAHAAGFVVATPDGHVARYFLGVRPDPVALRAALDDAGGERIGSLVDRLVLLCAHVDPLIGRHSGAVLAGLRAFGLALAAALALWIWRHRRTPPLRPRP